MPQYHLGSQGGLLALTREPSFDGTLESMNQEWLATELDMITLNHSPLTKSQTLLAHHRGAIYSAARHGQLQWISGSLGRVPANQSLLHRRNGILSIETQQPPPVYTERFLREPNQKAAEGDTNNLLRTLAPELRLSIYRHLLCSTKRLIGFPICRNKKKFENFRIFREKHLALWQFHRLHPQILQTCRLFNREGTPILYGENMFHRSFSWPGYGQLLPFKHLFPLSSHTIQFIRRIQIHESHSYWFEPNVDRLRVFAEFPALRELRIDADLNNWEQGTRVAVIVRRAIEWAARRSPPLKALEANIRLDFGDSEYRVWRQNLENRELNFEIHAIKAAEFAKWLPARFHKNMTWAFKISTSYYVDFSCSIKFTVDDRGSDNSSKGIPCSIEGDYGSMSSVQHFNIV